MRRTPAIVSAAIALAISVLAVSSALARGGAGPLTLEPAIAALGGPFRPQSTFRDLRPAHVVAGDGCGLAAAVSNRTTGEEQ